MRSPALPAARGPRRRDLQQHVPLRARPRSGRTGPTTTSSVSCRSRPRRRLADGRGDRRPRRGRRAVRRTPRPVPGPGRTRGPHGAGLPGGAERCSRQPRSTARLQACWSPTGRGRAQTAAGWQFLAIGSDTTHPRQRGGRRAAPSGTTRMTTLSRTDVVVALGEVEPGLVHDHLPASATFVANPTVEDLQVATGAIARADVLVDSDFLDRTPLLKVVARTGVGVDRVDVAEATRRGNRRRGDPWRRHQCRRRGHPGDDPAPGQAAAGRHRLRRPGALGRARPDLHGRPRGSTIGIVGYGRIGRRVAHLARAFGMTVLAFDPYRRERPGPGHPGGACDGART